MPACRCHTNLPSNYGEVHAGFYNGEGYSKVETNNQKGFMIRATLRPMPGGSFAARGLRITGFYVADRYVTDAPRTRAVGNIFYEHKHFNAGLDVMTIEDQTLPLATKVDGRGWSVFATPFFKEKGNGPEMLLRYDHFTPDTSLDQTRKRAIAGVAYWFPHPGGGATTAVLLDFEQVTFAGFPAVPAYATQKRLALHGLISF